MEDWRRDARREPIIVDLDALVPKDHLGKRIYAQRNKTIERVFGSLRRQSLTDAGLLSQIKIIRRYIFSSKARTTVCCSSFSRAQRASSAR